MLENKRRKLSAFLGALAVGLQRSAQSESVCGETPATAAERKSKSNLPPPVWFRACFGAPYLASLNFSSIFPYIPTSLVVVAISGNERIWYVKQLANFCILT
jgi:hypothetical protein